MSLASHSQMSTWGSPPVSAYPEHRNPGGTRALFPSPLFPYSNSPTYVCLHVAMLPAMMTIWTKLLKLSAFWCLDSFSSTLI
ncbi:mCG1028580 [Mus musculus]|nr:mCG1028580 [Mus musculus]